MTTPHARSLVGTLEIDGKKQKIEAKQFRLEVSDKPAGAALGPFDGRVVTESFSLSGDTLVTSVTDRNGDTTVTTTTTSDSAGTTTTTTTTDSSGTTTDIKIEKKK